MIYRFIALLIFLFIYFFVYLFSFIYWITFFFIYISIHCIIGPRSPLYSYDTNVTILSRLRTHPNYDSPSSGTEAVLALALPSSGVHRGTGALCHRMAQNGPALALNRHLWNWSSFFGCENSVKTSCLLGMYTYTDMDRYLDTHVCIYIYILYGWIITTSLRPHHRWWLVRGIIPKWP